MLVHTPQMHTYTENLINDDSRIYVQREEDTMTTPQHINQ